jgi:hypothetical protein
VDNITIVNMKFNAREQKVKTEVVLALLSCHLLLVHCVLAVCRQMQPAA